MNSDNEIVDKWYHNFVQSIKNGICKKCGHKGLELIGSCQDGCCDKWQCPVCKDTFLVELG